jgi:thiosulfate dehydrogenase
MLLVAPVPFSLGCEREVPGVELGARYYSDPLFSPSPFNSYACATCHAVSARGDRIDPGYELRDVVHRPSWWGGSFTRLLDAVNYCYFEFMGGSPMAADSVEARSLYEYFLHQSPDQDVPALPLTVVKNIVPIDLPGDPATGKAVYEMACRRCHGDARSGEGRLNTRVSVVPNDTQAVFEDNARLVTIEKIRHGKFFNIGGVMPLFSREAMSDEQIADLLAYLEL